MLESPLNRYVGVGGQSKQSIHMAIHLTIQGPESTLNRQHDLALNRYV